MVPRLLQTIRTKFRAAFRPVFHVSVTTLWSLGLISDVSMLLDDAGMQRRYDSAEREGKVTCHTAPVIILGNSGAGKTSLSLTLRDLPLPSDRGPPKTLGLEETFVEVSFVDMKWRDHKFQESLRNAEYTRALLYFVAAAIRTMCSELRGTFFLGHLKITLLQMLLFCGVLSFCFCTSWLPRYTAILMLCIAFHRVINPSHKIYFVMAYGSTTAIILSHFVLTQPHVAISGMLDAFTNLMRIFSLACACGLFLGMGTGSGFSLAFCLFNPDAEAKFVDSLLSLVIFVLCI